MNCKYSMVIKPCVIRDPSSEDCRACLTAMVEQHDQYKMLEPYTWEECRLCGLNQPIKDMSTDFRNGNKYCQDRTACWQRYDMAVAE